MKMIENSWARLFVYFLKKETIIFIPQSVGINCSSKQKREFALIKNR